MDPTMGVLVFSGVLAIGGIGAIVFLKWLDYRYKASVTPAAKDGKVESLTQRVEALEKQCAKLQEQMLDAHTLLADEQRQLDHKLAAILPEPSSTPPEGVAARERAQPERVRG
jgi:hypothetical protein